VMISAGERAKAAGDDPMVAMALAFQELLLDRDQLRVDLHAITASSSISTIWVNASTKLSQAAS